MKDTIRIKKIITFIKKYEKKDTLKLTDTVMYRINRHINNLDKDSNLIRHYISRLERIKLRFLEE